MCQVKKMQDFMLVKNTYFQETRNQGLDARPLPSGLTTKLKTVKTSKAIALTSGIYGQKLSFPVPRMCDNLSQIFIKMTLTGASDMDPGSYLATRVFKDVYIQGVKSGTVLSHIKPLYSLVRYDQVTQTSMQNFLQNCLDPNETFDTNTVSLYLPLFAFFADSGASAIPTRSVEDLEIIAYVNDSADLMVLQDDLTDASYEAFFVYYDVPETKTFKDNNGDNMLYGTVPRKLIGTYDAWYEEPMAIAVGSTSANILLRCPEPVFAIYFAVKDPITADFVNVTRFKLDMGRETVVDLDTRINFTLSTKDEVSYVDGSVVGYWFSEERNRQINTGLTVFTDAFAPSKLTVYFDETEADANLYVFYEVRTDIEVSKLGMLTRKPLGSLRFRNADYN